MSCQSDPISIVLCTRGIYHFFRDCKYKEEVKRSNDFRPLVFAIGFSNQFTFEGWAKRTFPPGLIGLSMFNLKKVYSFAYLSFKKISQPNLPCGELKVQGDYKIMAPFDQFVHFRSFFWQFLKFSVLSWPKIWNVRCLVWVQIYQI